jgi:phage tail-like protein
MAPAKRNDPYLSFKFKVEIKGVIEAGFSEVTGLQAEIETEEHREGGVNDYVRKMPKVNKYPNLIFKRGITDSDVLWKWYQDAVNGKIKRTTGSIILCDYNGNEKWRWGFKEAFPVKWAGPDFKSDGSVVAIETLELVHHGINKV